MVNNIQLSIIFAHIKQKKSKSQKEGDFFYYEDSDLPGRRIH